MELSKVIKCVDQQSTYKMMNTRKKVKISHQEDQGLNIFMFSDNTFEILY